jgi:hypothetical protein
MSNILDTLINLDTEDYYARYPDIQSATKSLSDVDRKLWILSHFVKHGFAEGRKHQLKTTQQPPHKASHSKPEKSENPRSKPDKLEKHHSKPEKKHHHHKKTEDSVLDDDKDLDDLIRDFRLKHNTDSVETNPVRDQSTEHKKPHVLPNANEFKQKKNCFWEIKPRIL